MEVDVENDLYEVAVVFKQDKKSALVLCLREAHIAVYLDIFLEE
jgi:hypothetical protein